MEHPSQNPETFTPLALTTEQAAKALGLSKTWMEQLRCHNRGPRWVKVGARVLYRPEDLAEWLEANLQQPSAA